MDINLNTALVYNKSNNVWEQGGAKLFLGQPRGLFDSINIHHPRLLEFYDRQKQIDWKENEVDLGQDIIDMQKAPKAVVDIMLHNLSYQWEVDSKAVNAFVVLLAPFITDDQFWHAQLKCAEIEGLHAKTYAEVVRQCIPDPSVIFLAIRNNKHITDRSTTITKALEDLALAGLQYKAGIIKNDQALFNRVFVGYIAMYLLERCQFTTSFSSTFITAENGWFQGCCKLIQKIAIDEVTVHAPMGAYVITTAIKEDVRAQIAMTDCHKLIKNMVEDIRKSEHRWAKYIFSEGRRVVGLNTELNCDYADYNIWEAELTLQLTSQPKPSNPLIFMDNWLNIDATQVAQQEADNTNYAKIFIQNDLREDEVLEF
jgi:ribonucleoside-diphosphate reductase beta chain